MKLKRGRHSHETQREWVYDQVKHMLMSGALAPGQKVTLARIASDLGVSMMPVREALRRLAAERALTMRPNRSVTVPRLSRAETLSIRAIRQMLEGHAAATAASLITEAEVERLAALQAELAVARSRARREAHPRGERGISFPGLQRRVHPGAGGRHRDPVAPLGADAELLLSRCPGAPRLLRHAEPQQPRARRQPAAPRPEGARHAIEAEIVEGSRLLDRVMREAKWDETAVVPTRIRRSGTRKGRR